jgi:hypothetical protein
MDLQNCPRPIFALIAVAEHDPQTSHHVPRELLFKTYVFANNKRVSNRRRTVSIISVLI